MFGSSDFGLPKPARDDARPGVFGSGEGRRSAASRGATSALLLPQGRPGAWLLLLAGACTYVLVQTVLLRLA